MSRFIFGEAVNINVGINQVPVTFAGEYRTRAGVKWLMFEGTNGVIYSRTENSFPLTKSKVIKLSEPEGVQKG